MVAGSVRCGSSCRMSLGGVGASCGLNKGGGPRFPSPQDEDLLDACPLD
jgi:hypothetical protein